MRGTKTIAGCPCVCHRLPPGAVVHVVSCCEQYQNRTDPRPAQASEPDCGAPGDDEPAESADREDQNRTLELESRGVAASVFVVLFCPISPVLHRYTAA